MLFLRMRRRVLGGTIMTCKLFGFIFDEAAHRLVKRQEFLTKEIERRQHG